MKARIPTAYLRPPKRNTNEVPRKGLIARLLRARAAALIAPAGFGKTVALSLGFEQARAAGDTVCWLTLASEMETPEKVLDALEAACGMAASQEALSWTDRMTDLLGMLEQAASPIQIFVDRLEVVAKTARAPLKVLWDAAPETVRVRLAGREGAGMALAKHALREGFDVFGPETLALAPEELTGSVPRPASPWIDRVLAVTDGWPVAVSLALRDRQSQRTEEKDPFSASAQARLTAYCDEEVFAPLPPDLGRFVLDLGVLRRFTAESAMELCGRASAGRDIERLADRGFFLGPSADEGEWLQLRTPLARFAHARLLRRDPARVRGLHRGAARWALERGVLDEAVRHAQSAGDPDFVADIVEQVGGWRLGLLGGPKAFPSTDALRETSDTRFPQIILGEIYFLAQSGRVGEARQAFERLRHSTAGFRRLARAEKIREFAAYARTLDAALRLYEDRPVRIQDLEQLTDNHAAIHAGDDPIAGSTASLLALCRINLGLYDEAVEAAEKGLERVAGNGADLVEYFLRMKLAAASVALGRLDKAAHHLKDALTLAEALYGTESGEVSAALILRAGVHYEADETEAAAALFEKALEPYAPSNGWFELYAEGFSAAAALASLGGGGAHLSRVLSECRDVARKRRLVRLAGLADILEVREYVRSGEPQAALALAHAPGFQALLAMDRPVSPWRRRLAVPAAIEWARTLAALGRYSEAHRTLLRLDPTAFGDLRQRMTYEAIATGVNFNLGRRGEAVRHLDAALGLAVRTNFVRRLRNHRNEMHEALVWARGQSPRLPPASLALAERVLHSDEPFEAPATVRVAAAPVYPLSPREMSVLELISAGCSTKEIARRLTIAEGTVKTHRKKIYQKLGVHNRSSALARARESQLL